MISSAAAIFYSPLMFWFYHGQCEFQSNLWQGFKGLQLQIILQKLSPSSFLQEQISQQSQNTEILSEIRKLWPTEKKEFSPKPEAVLKIEKNGNGNQFAFLQRPYIPHFKSLKSSGSI